MCLVCYHLDPSMRSGIAWAKSFDKIHVRHLINLVSCSIVPRRTILNYTLNLWCTLRCSTMTPTSPILHNSSDNSSGHTRSMPLNERMKRCFHSCGIRSPRTLMKGKYKFFVRHLRVDLFFVPNFSIIFLFLLGIKILDWSKFYLDFFTISEH